MTNKGAGNDRRVKYTKMVLKQSLLELMKEKPISKITIKEICEGADINRGTFYTHYSDQYDLLAQIENELLAEIEKTLISDNSEIIAPSSVIPQIFNVVDQNRDLCRVLFSGLSESDFLRRILYIASEKCLKAWQIEMTERGVKYAEYLYSFTAHGSIGIIQQWVNGGMKERPQEIALLVEQATQNGLSVFFKNENTKNL